MEGRAVGKLLVLWQNMLQLATTKSQKVLLPINFFSFNC
jgi:hypothetical protein